jgi:hypothetical protein
MLETRENPALMYWDPLPISGAGTPNPIYNLSSTHTPNWVDDDGDRGGSVQQNGQTVAGPTSSDTLIFGAVVSGFPHYSNPSTGGGGVGTTGGGGGANTLDCYLYSVPYNGSPGHVSAHVDYFGWTLLAGYGTGTVHLQQSSSVSYYMMHGGNLDQVPVSGGTNEVTVYNLLNWTKGTINTNSVPGKLTIHEGASGWIEPLNGGEVATNNTLTIDGDEENEIGGNVTQAGGTLSFVSAGRQLLVKSFAHFTMTCAIPASPPPGAPPVPPAPVSPPMATVNYTTNINAQTDNIIVSENGVITVSRPDNTDTPTSTGTINGSVFSEGSLVLQKFTSLQMTKSLNNNYTYRQDGALASTVLAQGAILESTSEKMIFGKGRLLGYFTVVDQESVIKVPDTKQVYFTNELNIRISMTYMDYSSISPSVFKIGDLKIDGNLVWQNATFHTFGEKKNNVINGDRIKVTGYTNFESTPIVKVYWSSLNMLAINDEWVYFTTAVFDEAQTTKPTVQLGGQWQSFTNPDNITFTDVVKNSKRTYTIKRTG